MIDRLGSQAGIVLHTDAAKRQVDTIESSLPYLQKYVLLVSILGRASQSNTANTSGRGKSSAKGNIIDRLQCFYFHDLPYQA